MRKDKHQVIGEAMTDEQVRLFLAPEPAAATPAALHKLIKAYRGLRLNDFARFVGFFVEAGYDLAAKDKSGRDFAALIEGQRGAAPYIEVVKTALAEQQ